MKIKFLQSIFLLTWIIFLLPLNEAIAASQDECAIWLCLPSGFGQGCGRAHSAFKKRLKKGKSPLPSWESCAIGDDTRPPNSHRREFNSYKNTTFYYGSGS